MNVIESRELKNGQCVEIYRAVARKSGLNYLRGVGHGALDVVTLGAWEIVGTPLEGAISENRGFITVRVIYETCDAHEPQKIEFYNQSGNKVKENILSDGAKEVLVQTSNKLQENILSTKEAKAVQSDAKEEPEQTSNKVRENILKL